jgi:hypothetical protein
MGGLVSPGKKAMSISDDIPVIIVWWCLSIGVEQAYTGIPLKGCRCPFGELTLGI